MQPHAPTGGSLDKGDVDGVKDPVYTRNEETPRWGERGAQGEREGCLGPRKVVHGTTPTKLIQWRNLSQVFCDRPYNPEWFRPWAVWGSGGKGESLLVLSRAPYFAPVDLGLTGAQAPRRGADPRVPVVECRRIRDAFLS